MPHSDFSKLHELVMDSFFTDTWSGNEVTGVTLYPENHKMPLPASGAHGRVWCLPGNVRPYEIGVDSRRGVGVLMIQLFLPVEGSARAAYQVADVVSNGLDYTAKTGSGVYVQYNVSSMTRVTSADYQQFTISLSFKWDSKNTTSL